MTGHGHRHEYLSTACFHEQAGGSPAMHAACRSTCKFCDSPCSCPRHAEGEGLAAPGGGWTGQAREIARELLEHAVNAGALPLDLLRRIEYEPSLFWLRGEEQPPGQWRRDRG